MDEYKIYGVISILFAIISAALTAVSSMSFRIFKNPHPFANRVEILPWFLIFFTALFSLIIFIRLAYSFFKLKKQTPTLLKILSIGWFISGILFLAPRIQSIIYFIPRAYHGSPNEIYTAFEKATRVIGASFSGLVTIIGYFLPALVVFLFYRHIKQNEKKFTQ